MRSSLHGNYFLSTQSAVQSGEGSGGRVTEPLPPPTTLEIYWQAGRASEVVHLWQWGVMTSRHKSSRRGHAAYAATAAQPLCLLCMNIEQTQRVTGWHCFCVMDGDVRLPRLFLFHFFSPTSLPGFPRFHPFCWRTWLTAGFDKNRLVKVPSWLHCVHPGGRLLNVFFPNSFPAFYDHKLTAWSITGHQRSQLAWWLSVRSGWSISPDSHRLHFCLFNSRLMDLKAGRCREAERKKGRKNIRLKKLLKVVAAVRPTFVYQLNPYRESSCFLT